MEKFLITSTPILDGMKILSYLGIVNTNIVIGTNFFSDFAASFTDVFGGSSGTYQRKMDNMYDSAKKILISKAKSVGANAVIGFKIEFDEISGKGKSMFMLSATGTACIVEEQQDGNTQKVNISNVDAYDLKREMIKMTIMDGLSKSYYSMEEDKWDYILENPSVDIAKLLVDKMYYQYNVKNRQRIEALVSKLDFEEAVTIVYPNFIQPKIVKFKDQFGNEMSGDQSEEYLSLIKNCKLFEPSYVIKLIDNNLHKAISLLECEKSYYSAEDLKNMEIICDKLKSLPDTGRKEKGKTGMFSKEKELWICSKGHKNELDSEFCSICSTNIKGLSINDMTVIDSFRKRTTALANLLKA